MDTLTWHNLYQIGQTDNARRWYPDQRAPQFVHDYVKQYRAPSRAWPWSYAKPLLTAKFARHAIATDPVWARQMGLIGEPVDA